MVLTKNQARSLSLPLVIAIGYVLASYVLSLRSVCLELDDVDFDYASLFSCSETLGYAWLPLLQVIGLLIGFYGLGAIKQTFFKAPKFSLGFRVRSSSLAFLSLLIVASIFSFYVLKAIEGLQFYEVGINVIQRQVGDKGATSALLIGAGLSVINLHTRKYNNITFALICLLSLLFAWLDGTRGAILPFLVYTYYYASQRKWGLALSMALIGAFLFILSVSSRWIGDKSIDSLLVVVGESVSSLSSIRFSYLFQFSYLHLMYVIDQAPYQFDLNDLLFSIIPLPSSFHFFSADPDLWRVDLYRPMGAMGELFIFSPIVFIIFNVAYGILVYKADRLSNLYVRLLTTCLILISFATSFQYHLRTVQWSIYLSMILIYSCRSTGKLQNQDV